MTFIAKILYITIGLLVFFTATTDVAVSLNVGFNESTYSIDEGSKLVVTLILSEASSTNITVVINSVENTSTAGK